MPSAIGRPKAIDGHQSVGVKATQFGRAPRGGRCWTAFFCWGWAGVGLKQLEKEESLHRFFGAAYAQRIEEGDELRARFHRTGCPEVGTAGPQRR